MLPGRLSQRELLGGKSSGHREDGSKEWPLLLPGLQLTLCTFSKHVLPHWGPVPG